MKTSKYGITIEEGAVATNMGGGIFIAQSTSGFRTRLWFLLTCIPRYLFTGSLDMP